MPQVIDKGYFSEAFLFKPRGGRSPPSGLNRKPKKNPLFIVGEPKSRVVMVGTMGQFFFKPEKNLEFFRLKNCPIDAYPGKLE